jgi:hypothetical protein
VRPGKQDFEHPGFHQALGVIDFWITSEEIFKAVPEAVTIEFAEEVKAHKKSPAGRTRRAS